MKLFCEIVKLLFRKYIKRESTGYVIKKFCELKKFTTDARDTLYVYEEILSLIS